jgi:vitamin B12 transporter
VPPGEGEVEDDGRNELAFGFAPRLGARLRIVDGLQLRATAGRYFRPPTLLELFGDRGYIIGNEGLRPESGTAVDGGLVLDLDRDRLDVYATAAGFAVWSEDLIQWIATGLVTRPENIAAARVRGLEASLHVEPERRAVTLTAHYTLTDSEDRGDDPTFRGRALPGRPRHDVFARGTAGWEWSVRGMPVEPRILYTAEVIAGTFLDPSGRLELPARALQGIGVELHLDRRVHFSLEVRNLLDVRTASVLFPIAGARPTPLPVSDFIGYPLPGRSLWAELVLDLPFSRRSKR